LLPLINDVQGHRITDQIKALRRQLAQEMGFVMPAVRHPRQYAAGRQRIPHPRQGIRFRQGRALSRQLPDHGSQGLPSTCPAPPTTEPAFGLPATWVSGSLKEEASFRGFTVVDPGTVLTTHLTEVLKNHMSELLSYAETKKLLDDLPPENKSWWKN